MTDIKKSKIKILISLDGGGIRGLITIYFMRYLEKVLGLDITTKASMMCGTSTGGIIAFGKLERLTNQQLEELYVGMGKEIMKFSCSNLIKDQSVCNTSEYTKQLSKYFNSGNILQFHQKEMMAFVTTSIKTDESTSTYEPFILSNYVNPKRKIAPKGPFDINVVDALRATSAIPMLFQLPRANNYEFFDGGLSHNNPTQLLYKEANQMFEQDSDTLYLIISFGTGYYKKQRSTKDGASSTNTTADMENQQLEKMLSELGVDEDTEQDKKDKQIKEKKEKEVTTKIKNFIQKIDNVIEEASRTAKSFVSIMKTLSRVSDSHKAHKHNKEVFTDRDNIVYLRFNPLLTKQVLLNDCSEAALKQMESDVQNYIDLPKTKNKINLLQSTLCQYNIIDNNNN